jgi:hypothetical protein
MATCIVLQVAMPLGGGRDNTPPGRRLLLKNIVKWTQECLPGSIARAKPAGTY